MLKSMKLLLLLKRFTDKLVNGVYKQQAEKLLEEQNLSFKPL